MGLMAYAFLILTASLALSAVQADPTPLWYSQFTVNFNETTRILLKRQTIGTWWYDAAANVEVVERADGNGDRYCGSIHPIAHTPCRHVVTNGNRYLIFPEMDQCCKCCTADQGCGVLRSDWLADSSFEGQESLRGIDVFKFSKGGLQKNYYYSTADGLQIPVELDQVPNDYMSFDAASFSVSPVPPELLEIPSDCHEYCPLSSICTLIRSGATTAY